MKRNEGMRKGGRGRGKGGRVGSGGTSALLQASGESSTIDSYEREGKEGEQVSIPSK